MDAIAEQLANRLRNDPNDAQAYEALKNHYRDSVDIASLVNLIEGWAEYQTNEVLASEALLEGAREWYEGGGDLERTRNLYERSLQRDPENRDAAGELIAVLNEAGDQHALAEFLDGYVRTLETHEVSPTFLAELYTQLGDLWSKVFERPDVARPCYERALELDPTYTSAAYAARKIAQETGDNEASAELYALEAEAENDPERKVQLYAKLAELDATQRDDLDGAIAALRSALSVTPGDVQIMHQLASYLGTRATRLKGKDAERDRRRAAELYYQIAQSVDADEAVTYLEAVLAAAPNHDGALASLEQLAPKLGMDAVLPQYWVAYLANAGEGPEVDQRRIYLAQAYEQSGQLDDAIYCLEQAQTDAQVAGYLATLRSRRNERTSAPPPEAPTVPPPRRAARHEGPTVDLTMPTQPPNAEPVVSTVPVRARKASPLERPREASRLSQLHKTVHELVAARKSDEAAQLCREILELDPGDPEAFSLLESHYRKTRDHARLRELLLASTRVGGLSVDARKLRLREVAGLCETKLKDTDGAIEAWQGVVALDPADSEAVKSLKRLLQKAQRWDDLAAVLEREALATTRTEEKIELISQIAAIHRDKRKDLVEAAEALRQLLALRPDSTIRNELCDMLLTVESFADAVPLLRERINAEEDERERVRLLRTLAHTFDEKLDDADEAYAAYQELLSLRPKDTETLERMQRIDEKSGNVARLLGTLERRAMIGTRVERPALFLQMGELAQHKLDDVDKAAEYYGNVLDLEPDNEAALGALYSMFESRSRYADLVELLRERVLAEKEQGQRVELYRRIARMLDAHLHQQSEAADAYRSILSAKEDEEALRFLVAFERQRDTNPSGRVELLHRLTGLVSDRTERRELLHELAELLRKQLARPREALEAYRKIIDEVDPDFEPALAGFTELCEQLGDAQGLGRALERKLSQASEPDERIALARRLSDLYATEDATNERAIDVLLSWTKDDPEDLEPRRRVRSLLEGKDRHAELLATLDALANLEEEFEARDQAGLEGAALAWNALHDFDGAWTRLSPLVEEGRNDARALLLEITRKAGRSQDLAALCVRAAQEASDPEIQGSHWSAAAKIFSDELADPTQALEAGLRMLATDLDNREYLGQIEEYAARAGAWTRLNQVYDKLIKRATEDAERAALLVRHAGVLDERAHDASEALDRVLRACALLPSDDSLLARAEELARRADRSEELLVVYDRRRSKTTEDTEKVDMLLRAARLCDGSLQDRERANIALKAALAVAQADPALASLVVGAAREFDRKRPGQDPDEVLRALLRAHREIAEKSDPDTGAALIMQAQALLRDQLDDERAAFDLLRQGVGLFPLRDDLYVEMLRRAIEAKRLDAVDAHLSRAIDEAMEPKTAAVLLERRANLLEGPLGRPEDAVDVFARLMQLRPDDTHAAEKLRHSLRQAKRYQDLLLAIHKQMQRVRNAEEKLRLLKDTAHTWEIDLKNRWEALDAWRKVADFAPDDREAQVAVERLERRSALPPARSDAELFSDDEPHVEPNTEAGESAQDESDSGVLSERDALAALSTRTLPPAELASEAVTAESVTAVTAVSAAAEAVATPAFGFDSAPLPAAAEEAAEAEVQAAVLAPQIEVAQALPTAEEHLSRDPEVAEEHAASDDLAMFDALLAQAPRASIVEPPPSAATELGAAPEPQIDVQVEVEDSLQESEESEPPAPRLTKPPTLPPRRSRSVPPQLPAAARAASAPPPLPPTSKLPARASLPPPLPSPRSSQLPPIPAPRSASAAPPPPAPRKTSLPPPLPSRNPPTSPQATESAKRGDTVPPPLPRRDRS